MTAPTPSISGMGDRLREARELAGVSARELDRLANRPEGHAAMIERGDRPRVEVATASAYADVLGLTLDWLARGTGESPNAEHVRAAVQKRRDALKKAPRPSVRRAQRTTGAHRASAEPTKRAANG